MICHAMDVSQIAHRHFRESCCAQELGGRLYAFPALQFQTETLPVKLPS